MTRFLRVRPFSHPSEWTNRLALLGCALVGAGIAAAWNPIAHPGPMCCLLRRSVGLPCPMCGMTRGVALCVRGRFLEAEWYNPLAVPFVILAALLCLKWIFEIVNKKSIDMAPPSAWKVGLWVAVYVALLSSWAYLLVFRREDDFASTWLGQTLHLFQ